MKSFVTLEQHVCPVCTAKFDTGAVLLDRQMREKFEHHTVTGTSMCEQCKKLFDEGYLALVECDPKKTGVTDHTKTVKNEDAYRTGQVVHIRRTVAREIINIPIPDDLPMMFCDPDTVAKLKQLAGFTDE